MNPERLEALRMALAKEHGVLLDSKDPLFIAVTLNELVMGELLSKIEAAAQRNERQGAALMAQEVAKVKETAERMIANGARYLAEEVRRAGQAAEQRVIASLDERVNRAEAAAATVEKLKSPVMLAAGIGAAAALLTVGVALGAALG